MAAASGDAKLHLLSQFFASRPKNCASPIAGGGFFALKDQMAVRAAIRDALSLRSFAYG